MRQQKKNNLVCRSVGRTDYFAEKETTRLAEMIIIAMANIITYTSTVDRPSTFLPKSGGAYHPDGAAVVDSCRSVGWGPIGRGVMGGMVGVVADCVVGVDWDALASPRVNGSPGGSPAGMDEMAVGWVVPGSVG